MTRPLTLDDLTRLQIPTDPTISPDGRTVVYSLRSTLGDEESAAGSATGPTAGSDGSDGSASGPAAGSGRGDDAGADSDAGAPTLPDADRYRLWMVGAAGGDARPLTTGRSDTSPRFSPSGDALAFVRAAGGPGQLYLLDMTGPGEPRQLTTLPLGAGAPVWSPDGGRIAFTAPVDRAASPTDDAAAVGKRRASAPQLSRALQYKADGAGMLGTLRTQLFVLDVATGASRQLTDVDGHLGAPSWHPDGSRIIVSGSLAVDGDVDGTFETYVVDPGEEEKQGSLESVGFTGGLAALGRWTPDGRDLLIVGRLTVEVGHANLLRVHEDGELVADLAAALDRNIMPGGPGYPGGVPQVASDGVDAAVLCS